jgi:hypothetical protein
MPGRKDTQGLLTDPTERGRWGPDLVDRLLSHLFTLRPNGNTQAAVVVNARDVKSRNTEREAGKIVRDAEVIHVKLQNLLDTIWRLGATPAPANVPPPPPPPPPANT